MPTNTYVELDRKTIANTSTTFIEFTSIPQTYTDLVIVVNMTNHSASGNYIYAQFGNGSVDTGANYSTTVIGGSGSSTASIRWSNRNNFNIDYFAQPTNTEVSTRILQLFNYSNTTTFKTGLNRSVRAGAGSDAAVGTWRSTSAINTIRITTDANFFAVGSTFSLYGIKAWADTESTPKATGGYVYQDSTYWYHAFPFSGTFTPNQSLTADVLVVAGGGAGGTCPRGNFETGGGGGAGGLLAFTSQALTATNYSVTVGGGGAGASSARGANGSNSAFGALTAAVGGGAGGGGNATANSGGSGGGGQGWGNVSGGAGTAGQGNAGGAGFAGYGSNGSQASGGGGGKGSAGASPSGANNWDGGAGGAGDNTYSTWAAATSTGVSGFYAGGGGAASSAYGGNGGAGGSGGGGAGIALAANTNGTAGVAATGGGGGGTNGNTGGSGGSGVVIVRYAK